MKILNRYTASIFATIILGSLWISQWNISSGEETKHLELTLSIKKEFDSRTNVQTSASAIAPTTLDQDASPPNYLELVRSQFFRDSFDIMGKDKIELVRQLLEDLIEKEDVDGKIHFTISSVLLTCAGFSSLDEYEENLSSLANEMAKAGLAHTLQGSGSDALLEKHLECSELDQIVSGKNWQDFSMEAAERGNVSARFALIESIHQNYDALDDVELSEHLDISGNNLLDLRSECEPKAFQLLFKKNEIAGHSIWTINSPYGMEVERYANLYAYIKYYEERVSDAPQALSHAYKHLNSMSPLLSKDEKRLAENYGASMYHDYCEMNQ